jgi:protein-disulfide isomerase
VLAGNVTTSLADDDALIRFGGEEYGVADASPRLRQLLYDLEVAHYEQHQMLADELLFEIYLKAESEERGVEPAVLARELLNVQPIDEEAVRRFYDDNAARIGQPYEEVRSRIAEHLRTEALRAKQAELLDAAKDEGDFELLLPPPSPPPIDIATRGYPRRGAESPSVTIVEFGDYQCPRCRRAADVLHRLVEEHPDHVQVIYMDFPINRSGISRKVAEGAVCAQAQDQFWPYHDLAFAHQARLDHDSPMKIARTIGLDEDAFSTCLDKGAGKARVAHAEREARRLGLRATPSIFVNGRPFRSRHMERDLENLIDDAIDAKRG